jgi:hypothetical protein
MSRLLLALALALWGATALAGPRGPSRAGELCVAPLGSLPIPHHETDAVLPDGTTAPRAPAKAAQRITVRIDDAPALELKGGEGALVSVAASPGPHRVRVACDGSPCESLQFRFEDHEAPGRVLVLEVANYGSALQLREGRKCRYPRR